MTQGVISLLSELVTCMETTCVAVVNYKKNEVSFFVGVRNLNCLLKLLMTDRLKVKQICLPPIPFDINTTTNDNIVVLSLKTQIFSLSPPPLDIL